MWRRCVTSSDDRRRFMTMKLQGHFRLLIKGWLQLLSLSISLSLSFLKFNYTRSNHWLENQFQWFHRVWGSCSRQPLWHLTIRCLIERFRILSGIQEAQEVNWPSGGQGHEIGRRWLPQDGEQDEEGTCLTLKGVENAVKRRWMAPCGADEQFSGCLEDSSIFFFFFSFFLIFHLFFFIYIFSASSSLPSSSSSSASFSSSSTGGVFPLFGWEQKTPFRQRRLISRLGRDNLETPQQIAFFLFYSSIFFFFFFFLYIFLSFHSERWDLFIYVYTIPCSIGSGSGSIIHPPSVSIGFVSSPPVIRAGDVRNWFNLIRCDVRRGSTILVSSAIGQNWSELIRMATLQRFTAHSHHRYNIK